MTSDQPTSSTDVSTSEGSARLKGLLARVLTAAVLVPLAVLIVVVGGRLYAAVIAFMLILLIFEWARIVDGAEFSRGFYTLSLTAIVTVFLAAGGQYVPALGIALGGGALATILERGRRPAVSWPFAGAIYLLVPAVASLYIRHLPEEGMALTLILFTTVWATDSGAYLAGTFIGGPKLWPKLSPRKTWTGAIGGVICGSLCTFALGQILNLETSSIALLVMGAAIGVAAIIGDLFESALKRAYNVKDTGGAFPGHGGVLDRLDGFIVAASALALLLLFRQHIL